MFLWENKGGERHCIKRSLQVNLRQDYAKSVKPSGKLLKIPSNWSWDTLKITKNMSLSTLQVNNNIVNAESLHAQFCLPHKLQAMSCNNFVTARIARSSIKCCHFRNDCSSPLRQLWIIWLVLYLCSTDATKLHVDYMNKNRKCAFNYKISMIIVSVVWSMMARMKKHIPLQQLQCKSVLNCLNYVIITLICSFVPTCDS